MDAMFWVTLVGVLVAIVAAWAAWAQARAARVSRRDADAARDEARAARDESARLAAEANALNQRKAEAQEEANRIEREKMAPPDWTHSFVGGSTFRVLNTSGGPLNVSEVATEPSGVGVFAFGRRGDPGVYDYGDSIEYLHHRVFGPNPEKVLITYRRNGDEKDRTFIIPL